MNRTQVITTYKGPLQTLYRYNFTYVSNNKYNIYINKKNNLEMILDSEKCCIQ